jgi:hypothetical protein
MEAGRRTRAMAAGQAVVMRALGFARFAVVRHHRSGRDAHRMARDHPVAVERIAVLAMALPATLVARPYHEPDGGAAVGGPMCAGRTCVGAAALSEADRLGADVRGADLSGADLRETDLGTADLTDC